MLTHFYSHFRRERVFGYLGLMGLFISLVFLVLGLTMPILDISATMSFFGVSRTLFEQSQTILESVETLYRSGNSWPAFLIFLFSIVFPILKNVVVIGLYFLDNVTLRARCFVWVKAISKWSMVDVFVVSIFVAYLSASATDPFSAAIGVGFYYFSAYCILSLVSMYGVETYFSSCYPPASPLSRHS